MTTLYVTRGLPASGKTTAAKQWVEADNTNRARVNRDDLRTMATNGFVPETEHTLTAARNRFVGELLARGVDVVVDDTNLRARVLRDLAGLARRHRADFQVWDFTHVPVDECVRRDQNRDRPVGEQVIRGMHDRYLAGRTLPLPVPDLDRPDPAGHDPVWYVPKPGTPRVVLVDIDGTVALRSNRSPFDWSRVAEDAPNLPVLDVVNALYAAGNQIVFLSGRSADCYQETRDWLLEHVQAPFAGLFMRGSGDYRKDSVVKVELFDVHIRDRYTVTAVLDDRDQVVEAWRELGLTCLQVAAGDF